MMRQRLTTTEGGFPSFSIFSIDIVRLVDVRKRQNKEGKTVLYLVFEYMDTDLINKIRMKEENIISLLRMLSSRLMGVKQRQNKEGKTVLYLVFEYMDTALKKFIRTFRQTGDHIPSNIIKSMMYHLCKGVAFCHGHGVLHRNLKPHNLLIYQKTTMLKIADLGLARAFTQLLKKYPHEILTLWYRAPEVVLGSTHYSTAVDIWSVGCIFAELVNKTALFSGDSELHQLLHIFRIRHLNFEIWFPLGPSAAPNYKLHISLSHQTHSSLRRSKVPLKQREIMAEKSAVDAFEKLEVGEGTYGKVYKAREKATGKIVALKKTKLLEDDEGVPPTTLREITLLLMLSRDPHIVRLMDVKQGQNKEGKTVLYLVFEYMDTDLKKLIRTFHQTRDLIPSKIIKSMMYQLCKGVAFCHGHGVLHRDLKPRNLLMDRKTMMLKIADLGPARAFTLPIKKYTHEILTLWYRAPEVLLGATHYSTAVDIWSVGCIFAELVNKTALFAGDSELQQLLHIFRLLGTPNEQVWPGVSKLMNWHEYPQCKPQKLSASLPTLDEDGLDLLSKMLEYEPAKRISAKNAMEHPYFND